MIKIEIPKFDFNVTINQIESVPYGVPGVYLLYNEDGALWYVGKASDIRSRVCSHFRGRTNTSIYKWNIHHCNAFIEENPNYRSIYETYLIDKYSPPLNIQRNIDSFKGSKCLIKSYEQTQVHPAQCRFILSSGMQCSKAPKENGYCYLHGGDTQKDLQNTHYVKGGNKR